MLLLVPRAGAQSTAGSVPVLLQVPATVRSAGLQGAGAALVGDAGSVFTNPAGLATIRHIGLEGAYWKPPLEGYVTTGALGWRIRQFDLGLGLQYVDMGVSTGGPTGPAGVRDYEVQGVGSLIYRFGLIAFGGSIRGVRQSMGGQPLRALSGDIGLAIAIFDIMALGLAFQNVAGNWDRESALEMPGLTRAGFTMNYVDPQETFRLLSTIEWQWPEGTDARFILGGEGGVVLSGIGIIGRVAYASQPEGSPRPSVTYGASLKLGVVDIDAAFEPATDTTEAVQRIGLRVVL